MPQSRTQWWLMAGGAAATAGAAYCVLRGRATAAAADETDFAGFLSDPDRLAAAQARPSAPAAAAASTAKPRAGGDPTGFDTFLRAVPEAAAAGSGGGDPTGFDAFLRAVPKAAGGAGAGAAAAAAEDEQPPPPDRAAVCVLYGTEYGFSREIAEKLVEQLKAGDGFW
jgi:sulfite reductase (NADPH) flavoprotein alpha-component